MNTVKLLQPTRIVFGNGCAEQCIEMFAERGVKRVLLVTSPSVLPKLGKLIDGFLSVGCKIVQSLPIEREPTLSMFEERLQAAQAERVDAVLGVGGGSPLDVAKLIAALSRSNQTIGEVFGINLLKGRELPLVCVPTTSGTGSEVSPNAVLLDEKEELKKAVISPRLVPDAAFIDPLMTVSVPPAVTAATGLDALTHCIEAYANKYAHPVVDLHALEGIRLIAGGSGSQARCALERAVVNGSDIEAREQLSLGSLYGGLCLGPINTAAIHALAYPLGSRFHVAHGVSNALMLPEVLRFNTGHSPDRYADVAAALGLDRNGSPGGTAQRGIEYLARLSANCGVPQRLSQLGIPRNAIPWMAQSAMKVTRLLKNNLRPVLEADAVRIYEAVY